MALIKKIGIAVLGIAITIGMVGKFLPHLFMSLPFPLSIILWISTGHEMPPYFMPDAWHEDEIDTWTKDNDLIVATGAKSGTTFMLYCTHQIRTKGTDRDDTLFPDVSITTPWPDLRQSRAGTWAEQKERYNSTTLKDGAKLKYYWDHPSYPFRIFKSHYTPRELPVRKKGGKRLKYLAMVRNGLDVAASMTGFYSAHTDEFRNLFGGFPPDISAEADSVSGSDDHPVVGDLLPGGPLEGLYWGYVNQWWPYRSDPNVLLLHYTNVRNDLKASVEKIAKFLDVKLTPAQLDTVTDRCSIEHMKKVNKFHYYMPLNKDKGLWDPEKHYIVKDDQMVNTGAVGKGKFRFSEETVAKWVKAEEEQLGHDPALLKWAREGGEFPPVP